MRFQEIQKKDDWGSYSYFGAGKQDLTKALSEAAKASKGIRVRFPDGTVEAAKLRAKRISHDIPDHGHSYRVTTTVFYVKFVLHGIEILIPIEKLHIALEDLND